MRPARKGEMPTVEWAQWVEKTLRRLIDIPPPRERPITGGSGERPPFWTEISQVPDSDPAEYEVAVTLGYLSYQSNTPAAQASDLGTTGWIVPTIAGVSMEPPIPQTDPPTTIPKLPLPDVESWVYLRVKTDVDGSPKDGEVTVEAFDEAQESIHHIRLSPESGEEEGDYFFLILKTKADESDPPRPIPERRITGNREMPNQLIEILNLGEESEAGRQEVYKGYDIAIDKHDLRAVLQQQTPGVAIIEPLAAAVDAVPPVVVDGTVVTPGTPAVPAEEPGDYIRWRTVDGRASYSESSNANTTRQIEVRERDEDDEELPGQKKKLIEVVGNDFTNSFTEVKKFDISFNDGLIDSFTKIASDDEGWWGTIQWIFYPSGGGLPVSIGLNFEAGVLKRVRQDVGSAGGAVDVPGTEAAPSSIAHVTSDS